MSQPIKYWTTTIPATRSAAELLPLLVEAGATMTSLHYDDQKNPIGVSFVLHDPQLDRDVPVHLEARVGAVTKLLLKEKPWNASYGHYRKDHEAIMRQKAHRIVWRHLRDLVEQQLLIVRIGAFEITDLFLQGIVTQSGETVGQVLRQNADQVLGSSGAILRLNPGS